MNEIPEELVKFMTREGIHKDLDYLALAHATLHVFAHEKTPNRPMSMEEFELYTTDWRAYSKQRGYSDEEIAQFATHATLCFHLLNVRRVDIEQFLRFYRKCREVVQGDWRDQSTAHILGTDEPIVFKRLGFG